MAVPCGARMRRVIVIVIALGSVVSVPGVHVAHVV
jgi:hypothetical protein